MDASPNDSQRHARLAADIRAALDAGTLSEHAVERMLAAEGPVDRRRTLETVLVAIGALVVFAGIVLLYAVNYGDMSYRMRLVTPYAFPLAAMAATITLAFMRRQMWLQEAVMAVTALAATIASTASVVTFDSPNRDWYVLACAAVSSVEAGVLLRVLPRQLVMLWWSLAVSLGITVGATAWVSGVDDEALRWVALPTGIVFIAAGVAILVRTKLQRAAGAFMSVGTIMLFVASMLGINLAQRGLEGEIHLTPWHALFTLVIVAAIIVGASIGLPELAIVGGGGVMQWIGFAVSLVNEQPLWAFAIIAFGVVVVGGTIWAMRRRERHEHPERHGKGPGARPIAG